MERVQKGIVTLAVSVLALTALYVALSPPASGFENSVYRAYPAWMWVLFIIGFLTAFLGLYRSHRHGSPTPFLAVIISYYLLVYLLPVARGYRLHVRGFSDPLVHLGEVKAALATGHLRGSLWYPATHSLTAILSFFVEPETAALIVPFAGTLVLILFIALAIRSLADTKSAALAFFAALPLTLDSFHTYLHPAFLATAGLPVLVYLDINSDTIGVFTARLMKVLVLFWMVLTHPVTSIFGVILLLASLATHVISSRFDDIEYDGSIDSWVPSMALGGVAWAIWYSQFETLRLFIRRVLRTALGPGVATAGEASSSARSVENPIAFYIRWGVLMFGSTILPLLAGSAAVGLQAIEQKLRGGRISWRVVYVAVQLAVGVGLTLAFLIGYFGPTDPVRVSRYAVVMASIGIGIGVIHYAESDIRWYSVVSAILIVSVLGTAVLGVFSIHQVNKHMTEMEYSGVEHTIEYQNDSVQIRSHRISSKTYRYVLGTHKNVWPPAIRSDEAAYRVPPHLGYQGNDTAGASMGESYLITKEYDLQRPDAAIYQDHQRPGLQQYTDADLDRLHNDRTARAVYSNGEFQLWRVTNSTG